MSLLRRAVATEDGVYRPPSLLVTLFKAAFAALAVLTLVVVFLIRGLSYVLPYVAVFCVLVVLQMVGRKKNRPLGPPSVAVQGNTLLLAQLDEPKDELRLALDELQELVICGRIRSRTFRFIRLDGSRVEFTPRWGRRAESLTVEFLRRKLPPAIRITVAAPPTLFEEFRGDIP